MIIAAALVGTTVAAAAQTELPGGANVAPPGSGSLSTEVPSVGAAQPETQPVSKLQELITTDLSKFIERSGECLADCEERVRQGELAAGTDCSPAATDPRTNLCLLRAREAMTGSRSSARRVCVDREVDLFYDDSDTCPGQNATVQQLLACLQDRAEECLREWALDIDAGKELSEVGGKSSAFELLAQPFERGADNRLGAATGFFVERLLTIQTRP